MLNETPLGEPGRKQAFTADKQSVAKLSNVAGLQQTQTAAAAVAAAAWALPACDAVVVLKTCGCFLERPGLFSAG